MFDSVIGGADVERMRAAQLEAALQRIEEITPSEWTLPQTVAEGRVFLDQGGLPSLKQIRLPMPLLSEKGNIKEDV